MSSYLPSKALEKLFLLFPSGQTQYTPAQRSQLKEIESAVRKFSLPPQRDNLSFDSWQSKVFSALSVESVLIFVLVPANDLERQPADGGAVEASPWNPEGRVFSQRYRNWRDNIRERLFVKLQETLDQRTYDLTRYESTDPAVLWSWLQRNAQQQDAARRLDLREEFGLLSSEKYPTFHEFIQVFKNLVQQLDRLDDSVSAQGQIAKIFDSLPKDYFPRCHSSF